MITVSELKKLNQLNLDVEPIHSKNLLPTRSVSKSIKGDDILLQNLTAPGSIDEDVDEINPEDINAETERLKRG
jgi:hypothetical protein